MTIRRERLGPSIEIEKDLLHSYIHMLPEPQCPTDVEVWIKRLDGADLQFSCVQDTPCCGQPRKSCSTRGCGCGRNRGRWLLRYPGYDYRDDRIGFRWDCNLHQLPAGRYLAEVRVCGKPCHHFEMVSHCCPEFGGEAESQFYAGDCGPADGARDDVDGTFDAWLNYKTELREPLARTDIIMRVKAAPPQAAWDGTLPELVVYDGVNEVRLQVKWVNGSSIGVENPKGIPFVAGACVRFMWTPNNLAAAGYKNPNFIGYEDLYDCGDTELC